MQVTEVADMSNIAIMDVEENDFVIVGNRTLGAEYVYGCFGFSMIQSCR
jgi:hypothetical protein